MLGPISGSEITIKSCTSRKRSSSLVRYQIIYLLENNAHLLLPSNNASIIRTKGRAWHPPSHMANQQLKNKKSFGIIVKWMVAI